ncbi:MAG: phosphoenolpyruvate--protein phosphotransferase [Coprococcus sp.]|nr:phosphoenolpyruvate--protein phosphotransferase [Coprococcus sp.]
MMKYQGKSVYKGTAIGPAVVIGNQDWRITRKTATNSEKEIQKVMQGVKSAQEELRILYEKTLEEMGESSAAIFEVQQMMLDDEEYLEAVCHLIRTERVNAEYAVYAARNHFFRMLSTMEDGYMRERAADVKDMSDRLIRNILGGSDPELELKEPSVVVADDLSPSEVIRLGKEKILAVVTVHGSINSHTAILTRMMGAPTLVCVPMELDKIHTGMAVIVDGVQGEAVFEPDEGMCEKIKRRMQKEQEDKRRLRELKGKENITLSGKSIHVYANIGSAADVGDALENDAGGIGLFRSECLYLGRNDYPSEDEQFQTYRKVLESMGGKNVMIRTFDIGTEKGADYFQLKKEENPALGYRGIRICLKRPDLFKIQLRALFRAAIYGNLSIMYPMITSMEEVEKVYEIVEEVKRELHERQVIFRTPRQGLMLETPAAVMISDKLARIADFFSIGTNDLTQYTLAVDRLNEDLEDFYDPHHEAVLRMIQMAADNAHKYGKWVGICGELGADLELTERFIKMGIDGLSVSPSAILPLRKRIREIL